MNSKHFSRSQSTVKASDSKWKNFSDFTAYRRLFCVDHPLSSTDRLRNLHFSLILTNYLYAASKSLESSNRAFNDPLLNERLVSFGWFTGQPELEPRSFQS